MYAEPCESGLFSIYCNVHGEIFPCSFTEDEINWEDGLDVNKCNDFLRDIWFNSRIIEWRNNLINTTKDCNCNFKDNCRSCPVFPITVCKGEKHENQKRFCI